MADIHPLERDLETLWEFCRRVRTGIREGPATKSEQQDFTYGLVAYAIELATGVGWLTTVKNGPGAMTLMTSLEATQQTIEQVGNVMGSNDLRSVLRDSQASIKVKLAKSKNPMAKEFWDAVGSPLRTDCRHGGSVHWGWLMEAHEAGRIWEHSVANQRRAVLAANIALVQIAGLFGEAAQVDLAWNSRRVKGNVWRNEDLNWNTSINGAPWNSPYRAITLQAPPKGMSRVAQAIIQYEKTASTVFDGEWGKQGPQDSGEPWGEYPRYATDTALALAESVYNLVQAGMYGAAFSLARASWESAANAHYVWNEEPSREVLQFLEQEDDDRPIPLPKSRARWKDPTARRWSLLKGTSSKVLAELAKGERIQGQRWAPRVCNPEHCPYSEGELTNLVRFAEMNLVFLKASYFHFKDEESKDMFVKLMDQWEPEWPTFDASGADPAATAPFYSG